jgi:acyl-CoA thioester hydrolase
MNPFILPVSLRWADFDPNFHLRHSVYYDFGAAARTEYLSQHGITPAFMVEHHLGPVLFREEALFRREVRYGDELTISLVITKLRRDSSRFSFRHELIKADGTVCAIMNVDGAWIDTRLRKLTVPPPAVAGMAEAAPKSEDFTWLD